MGLEPQNYYKGYQSDFADITIIGNTGDDWNFYGLYVSPDIDSVLFTLSDLIDTKKWWGVKNDTFKLIEFLRINLKENVWFNLGDYDAGLCLLRSSLLEKGKSLTEATEIICKRLDIKATVLPMADHPIQTQIRTNEGTMHLQEFWVKHKGQPHVVNVFFEGNLQKTTLQVLEAIKKAKVIIFGPSNPISSLGPILAIHPLRKALQEAKGIRIAISPIIGDQAISGPTNSFLKAWKQKVSPLTVANLYKDVLDEFVLHETDQKYLKKVKELNITPLFDNILINSNVDSIRLMSRILDRI
ncbi:MAG: 2-phospho-L-lactate transferase [Candidatus Hodarchaeales archaeon]